MSKAPGPIPSATRSRPSSRSIFWTLSSLLLEKIVQVAGTHPYPKNELLLMTVAPCHLKPSVVFDWGTHIGVSARIFYECDQAFKLGYEIHHAPSRRPWKNSPYASASSSPASGCRA